MPFTESEWDAYVPITVANAQVAATMPDAGESGFPVVLVIDQANSVNYEGDAANIFTTVVSIANDIAVTLDDGATQLKHDEVEYVATDGSRLLVLHILIPSLAGASDTVLRLYYRDDGAADQQQTVYLAADNWLAYYGLHEAAAGAGGGTIYIDLSDNGNDADDFADAVGKTGQVGSGQQLDGTNDYIHTANSASLDSPLTSNKLTLMFWAANSNTAQTNKYVFSYSTNEWQIIYGYNARQYETWWNIGAIRHTLYTVPAANTAYHHIVATFDGVGNTIRGYADGAETLNAAEAANLADVIPDDGFYLGSAAGANWWNGYLDELGIRDVDTSANWITTLYNCQNDNDAFWTVGSEVAVGVSVLIPILMGADVRQAI